MQSPDFVVQRNFTSGRRHIRWGLRFGAEAAMALLILAASFGVVGALAFAVALGAIKAVS